MLTLHHLLSLPSLLSLLTYTTAFPTSTSSASANKPLPLLIWHGLGDRHDAEGLHSVGTLASKIHPGTHITYIRIENDGEADSRATFFGNVTEHISHVCDSIKQDMKLFSPSTGKARVDALGFSQGGQFLRGLIERCEVVDVRSLVTFGSQHNGISDVKTCGSWDLVCKGAIALMKGNAYSDYVQGHVVPAQYYRTLNETTGLGSEEYLKHSNFLADINNEREFKNEVYKERLAKVEKFVMYLFEDDTTVIPKQSGWFAEVNGTDGKVTPLRNRTIYTEDWIGLKKLDERGALVFKTTPGDHMQLSEEILSKTFKEYFGLDEVTRFQDQSDFDFNHRSMWPESAKVWDRMTEWARPTKEYL